MERSKKTEFTVYNFPQQRDMPAREAFNGPFTDSILEVPSYYLSAIKLMGFELYTFRDIEDCGRCALPWRAYEYKTLGEFLDDQAHVQEIFRRLGEEDGQAQSA